MKRTLVILLGCCLGLNSCYELDLNPLSQASKIGRASCRERV